MVTQAASKEAYHSDHFLDIVPGLRGDDAETRREINSLRKLLDPVCDCEDKDEFKSALASSVQKTSVLIEQQGETRGIRIQREIGRSRIPTVFSHIAACDWPKVFEELTNIFKELSVEEVPLPTDFRSTSGGNSKSL